MSLMSLKLSSLFLTTLGVLLEGLRSVVFEHGSSLLKVHPLMFKNATAAGSLDIL